MPSHIPWRLQHYNLVRFSRRDGAPPLPSYLEKRYEPYFYPSSGLHQAAYKIQSAWRRYKNK